jgi:hypothetical protein
MASLSNINGIFDVHSTGAIQFNGNHGTAGQILKSNGNAAPTWVAASTVIGGPYLPLTGGTLTGPLAGTSATFAGNAQAATFNGLAINTTGTNNVANQIVRTQANGYVKFGWINSVSGATTSTITRITASNDAYLRYVTPATFRTQITDPYYAPTGTVSGVTSVSGTGTVSGLTLTGTVTSTGNITLGGAISGFTELNMIRSLGTPAFTNGANPNITTAQVMAEIEADGGFDSFSSVFKTSWSYAGNYNLTDAGDFKETAGSSWITWTDNSSDTTRGNITTLAIAPNTGSSAGGVFIYNDQGSSYAPGWRQVWTSTTDGSGSGLDADLLDGQQGSYYAPASSLGNYLPLAGGTVTGSTDFTAGTYPLEVYGIGSTASSTSVGLGIYGSSSAGAIMHFHRPNAYAVNFGLDSDNIMRIGGWSANANRWFLDMSGNNTVAGSYRAPIFYDSLNTAYYGDFASTSIMSRINVGNGNSPAIQCVANGSYGAGTELEIGGWSTGTTVSKIRNSNGNLHIDSKSGHNLYLNHYPPGNILVGNGGGYLLAYQSVRSPIFYDSNNTGYYGNFASNSVFNTVTFSGGTLSGTLTMNTQKALVANNYGRGVYGLYNASRFQHLWSMGAAYNLADNGTSAGNLYGVAWSHPNAGGVAANLSNHGMLLLLNGGYQAAISGSIRCVTDMRTPIYYDSNNTAYYGNFASTSRLNTLNCDGAITSGTSSTGNIYCGNAGSTHMRLHVVGNTSYFDMNSGNISWRQGSSTRYIFYSTTANMTIYGTLTQGSDIRIKENIVEIGNCIDKVKSIRGVYYNRTDFNTEPTKIGVIAQEVEEQMPELVHDEPTTGIKSVSYTELTAVLVNAIKEQQVIIDDLKSRIEKLEL